MSGFAYPNEMETQWSLLIVLYPFITGLVAGAFMVSALYHVFGITRFRPIARFSLVAALAFLLVAPLPLLLHLGRPERALEMFLRPNFTSAMSGFGFIWSAYTLLVVVEIWLVFRRDIVGYAQTSHGPKKLLYSMLALGVFDVSEQTLHTDEKVAKVLAFIGIPSASLLHGYVGFIFGAVKANPWWSTPLMPLIFLLSAIVSGMALLLVMYVLVCRVRRVAADRECVSSLAKWLTGFLVIDLTLESLEVLFMLYESEESWDIISQLITQKLHYTFLGLQLGLGSLVPLFLLVSSGLARLRQRWGTALAFLASSLVLIGVFSMRWNVVIGGQMFSKSLRGFLTYNPPLMGREGVLVAAALMVLPLVLFATLVYFIPPWRQAGVTKEA
ncbi:MAG: polysulfide reductase NrfD [Chloroflexi bacterium]|nr:polysulfide reductase NrfD [Chloroflexota bacterium]